MSQLENRTRYKTHDDVHGLIKIHDDAFLVDDGHSGDRTFGEHVYDVKDGCVECCGGDGVEGVFGVFMGGCLGDIGPDAQPPQGKVELLDLFCTLWAEV